MNKVKFPNKTSNISYEKKLCLFYVGLFVAISSDDFNVRFVIHDNSYKKSFHSLWLLDLIRKYDNWYKNSNKKKVSEIIMIKIYFYVKKIA